MMEAMVKRHLDPPRRSFTPFFQQSCGRLHRHLTPVATETERVKSARRADLAEKAVGACCGSKLRVENLKRDPGGPLEIFRQLDRGHPPLPSSRSMT